MITGVRVTIYYKRFHQYIVLRKRRLINPALHCSLLFSVPHIFHSAVCVVYLARDIGVVHLRVVQVGSQFLGLLYLLAVLDHRHRCQPDPYLYQLVRVLWTLCSLWLVIGYYTWLEPVKMNKCCFPPTLKVFDFVRGLAQSFHDLKGSFPRMV